MEIANWFLLIGLLFLVIGLAHSYVQRLPVTTAMLCLAVGIGIGPMGLGLFHFNPLKQSGLLEIITEVVVLISLFSAGVKMPVPVRLRHWKSPIRLAFVSMLITVGLVTLFGQHVLGLPLGAAVLLGAIIAPTDPVLATDVQVRHPGDRDRLRFSLTSEAGMNDGSAFPFVMLGLGLLGLHELGTFGIDWILHDLIWATLAAIAVGAAIGVGAAYLIVHLQRGPQPLKLLDDFVGLGLIGFVYGISLLVDAWGFLAVFVAAIALRQTELRLQNGIDEAPLQLQHEAARTRTAAITAHPVSEGSLIFKEHLERISEVVLVLLIGGTLFIDSWSWRAIWFSAFLFLVARPLSVYIGLAGSETPVKIRHLAAWFGVRGVGSLYYLMYAIQHGLPEALSLELIHIVLVVVTLSIVLHGISVKPMTRKREPQPASKVSSTAPACDPLPAASCP